MAAGPTFTPIATSSPSGLTSVTFSSIPSTYTDLILVFSGALSANDGISLRLNSTYTNNNSITSLAGNGTSAASTRGTNIYSIYLYDYVSPGTTVSNIQAHVMNYSNTTTYKTILIRDNSTNSYTEASVGLWRDTSAVNQLIFYTGGATFSAGSTVTLFGILAA